jgi:hypothetical protein
MSQVSGRKRVAPGNSPNLIPPASEPGTPPVNAGLVPVRYAATAYERPSGDSATSNQLTVPSSPTGASAT